MKFQVTITKDLKTAENNLPKVGFIIYRKIVNAIYLVFIEKLAGKRLKAYNPVYEENKATFTEESEDVVFLQEEEHKLKSFLTGDVEELMKEEKIKKAMSNRWVAKLYRRSKSMIKNALIKNNVLTLLNSLSIFVKIELIESIK